MGAVKAFKGMILARKSSFVRFVGVLQLGVPE
jgi:hypothetical protein